MREAGAQPSRRYVAKHWRGELPLVQSFWMNLVGSNLLSAIVILMVEPWPLLALPVFFFTFAIWLWAVVGVWRSADAYSKRNKGKVWGNVASAAVVFQGLTWIAQAIP